MPESSDWIAWLRRLGSDSRMLYHAGPPVTVLHISATCHGLTNAAHEILSTTVGEELGAAQLADLLDMPQRRMCQICADGQGEPGQGRRPAERRQVYDNWLDEL